MPKKTRKVVKRKGITGEDLFKLRVPTSVSISPDESLVAYPVERMDKKESKYFSNIYISDTSNGEATQFTHGNQVDRSPVFSPDGERIAFMSTRDKKSGIYLMPTGGGAERKLIEIDGTITDLQWTPDANALVFALRYNDSHFIKDEKKKKEPPVYRHITRLFYRLDGFGFLPKDKFQIYALTLADAKLRKITSGKRDNMFPNLSPDGKLIAFISNRSKDPDMDLLNDTLLVVPFKGGKEKVIKAPEGPKHGPKFSPDGKTIAFQGHDNPQDAWGVTNDHIWKVGLKGKPKARDLMPKWDRMASDLSITDTGDAHFGSPIEWSGDGKRIYFLGTDTGATNLYYVPASGGKPTRVYSGKCHVKGYAVNGKTKKAAMIVSDLNNPGDVYVGPTQYGAEKRSKKLTDLNRFLRTEVKLGRTKEVMFRSFDGTKVQGWLLTPPDFNKNKKYPSVLEIHGGPRVQYAHSFFHEMQYLAAKGYVVFYTNPRGGQGRGETWADAITGGWGDLDYKDCMAAADWMESQKFIHPKKMGVTGGSYGGYMTNWIIGHTNRFKAAVTQRSIADLRNFLGTSDIGWDLEREFAGWPWSNQENYAKCSPITYYKKIKTPVLIIHSEQDLRCSIEQAEQMFVMLKVLKKTVEFVRFPEEPHGLSRHGRPDRRIARLEFISNWFDKYMK